MFLIKILEALYSMESINNIFLLLCYLDICRLLLYPSLATLLGIERLRQCCATWLLLEQYLLRHHNWKVCLLCTCSDDDGFCLIQKLEPLSDVHLCKFFVI